MCIMQTEISFNLLKVHLRKQLTNLNNNNYNNNLIFNQKWAKCQNRHFSTIYKWLKSMKKQTNKQTKKPFSWSLIIQETDRQATLRCCFTTG